MGDPVGETDRGALRLDFDLRLMLRFRGSAITSDGGLLVHRELDDVLALTTTGGEILADARTGKNGRHQLVGLLRQSVFGRLAGYEDVNDAERLCRDPAVRWVVGGRAPMGLAASASQMGRFETEWLTRPENFAALADLPGQWLDTVHRRRSPRIVVLDMDSSKSPTYGEQEGSAYNGHFGCTCYHPLLVSRHRGKGRRLYFRGDPAFANPEIYEFLEVEGMGYAIRFPANRILQEKIGYLLKRLVGRPPHEVRRYYASFGYQAQSWKKPRRVVAKVEWHPGELYPRVGFIVTNLARPAERVVAFLQPARHLRAMDQRREGSDQVDALVMPFLRCQRGSPSAPCAGLQPRQLHANPGDARGSGAVVPDEFAGETDQDRRKVVSHGRYVMFQMAEVAVPRQMFHDVLRLIARLRAPPTPA